MPNPDGRASECGSYPLIRRSWGRPDDNGSCRPLLTLARPSVPPCCTLRGDDGMTVRLNHTIVWCRDQQRSAGFLADVLGLPPAIRFGPFLVVAVDNDLSLDFHETDGDIAPQHYAFLVDEHGFDEIFARIRQGSTGWWADPARSAPATINHNDGGRGVYFEDPDGHLLEIITRPYGATS